MMRWSESDSYFVGGSLKVYSVKLSSELLKLVPEENVTYDGPKSDDFKGLLLDNGFRVNRQGKAIVGVPKRNDEEYYNFFLLETVIPLGPYGFTNLPSPTQEVKELKRLLEESRQEVKETRADLVRKNAEVDELHRNWNSEQLRLTLDAITESMKKVFVDVDLEPPAKTGYPPISVVGFLEKLRSLFVDKEFGATFLGAANEVLASIAGVFLRRNGFSFDMVKSIPSTSTPSPADLIKNLNFLREFVETRFFIDGSVIVKAYGLINEKDIPVIFRDSEAGVAELHRTEIGAKSIDNIDGKSIFLGYFNIPSVGKFKGALTRVNVTLPDEIMVKLTHCPNELDEKRFWFVEANGEAVFGKSLTPPPPESSSSSITEDMNAGTSSTGSGSSKVGMDFLGFLCRMNRIFVNKEGKYLKFDFRTATKYLGSPHIHDDKIFYYNESCKVFDPISKVQYDVNEKPQLQVMDVADVDEKPQSSPKENKFFTKKKGTAQFMSVQKPSLCEEFRSGGLDADAAKTITATNNLGGNCAFVFKEWCFIGKISAATGQAFRHNARISEFFEQSKFGQQNLYVDALATTFFVFNSNKTEYWMNANPVVPGIITGCQVRFV